MTVSLASVGLESNCHRRRQRLLLLLLLLFVGLLCSRTAAEGVVDDVIAGEEEEEGGLSAMESDGVERTGGSSGGDVNAAGCTVLQRTTTYKQEVAPTDIMGLFSAIYDRINEDLDDVVKVEINYVGGVIHRLVGRHDVRATVTRREDSGDDTTECMVVPVVIEDSNECTLDKGHAMYHQCDKSAECVNTIGSYECVCAWNEPCVPKSGAGFCQNVSSSAECCSVDAKKRPSGCRDNMCADECRKDFRCYTDQCEGKCVYPDRCTSTRDRATCRCKEGEVGNGRLCPGLTPKLYTDLEGNMLPSDVDPSTVCGCQVPTVDLCHGVSCGQHSSCSLLDGEARCVCKKGFREVPGHGCMDDKAPSLELKGPVELKMKQCDKYVERGVVVTDGNSENDDRNVGVSYSQPPGRCTPEMGSFTVNYTLNTGWTHPAVQYVVRHVTVEDVDECSLDLSSPEAQCPDCTPHCHRYATCENRVGTYACNCPACMSGDGFDSFVPRKSGRLPAGYQGGSGCRDSCVPVITLSGDDPLVFQVAVSTDIAGNPVLGRDYAQELSDLIARTDGGGLCQEGPSSRCATVLDNNGTHEGIDITHRLNILKPTQISKSPLRWQVSYEATDEAGNYAQPVVRTVEIQEMTMEEYAAGQVAEALENRPCPGCPKCPTCPKHHKDAQHQHQQPCAPCGDNSNGRGGGGGGASIVGCSECACRDRAGCMEVSDCTALSRDGVCAAADGSSRTCSRDEEGAGRGGGGRRWCLPVYLSGFEQVVIAVGSIGAIVILYIAAAIK